MFEATDPEAHPITRADFINHLVGQNGFKQIAPHTLIYKDEVDTIVVSLMPGVVIITHDGDHVIENFQIKQVRGSPDTYFWDGIMQDVLSRF